MSRLRKWRKKFKIYSKINIKFYKFHIKKGRKYILYINIYIINKLYINIYNQNKILNKSKEKYDFSLDLFKIWKNYILLINKINKYLIQYKVKNMSGNKNIFEQKDLLIEIYYLYYLNNINNININQNIIQLNYIFKISKFIELLTWIQKVNIDINLLIYKKVDKNIINLFSCIKLHQKNCKNILYFYNSFIFNKRFSYILFNIKNILLNYKFII